MQKPPEISPTTWARLKALAEPLEDDLETILVTILDAADVHLDCPVPTKLTHLMSKSPNEAPLDLFSHYSTQHQQVTEHSIKEQPNQEANSARDGAVPAPQAAPGIPAQNGAAPRDTHISQSTYYLPILEILADAGGAAYLTHVTAKIEERFGPSFTTADLEPHRSHPTRWRATLHNARQTLARQGCLVSHTKIGLWELSPEGWNRVRPQTNSG